MNGKEVYEIKEKIRELLLADEEVVGLLNYKKTDDFIPEDLIDNGIYSFYYIPDTQEEACVYLTIAIDIPRLAPNNDVVEDISIAVSAIAHKSLMKVNKSRANRVDLLSAKVNNILNFRKDFGAGYLKLDSSTEGTLDTGHIYRLQRFKVCGINDVRDF